MRALSIRSRVILIAVVAVAGATSATASSVSTARAASPVPVSIQATVTQGFSGVWQASGAISDSGSFERTGVHLTGSFFNSPTVGAFQAVFLFSGAKGTFTLSDELVANASGVNGNWQIVSGTGAYDGISGHGTSSFDFSTSTVNFIGVISRAG